MFCGVHEAQVGAGYGAEVSVVFHLGAAYRAFAVVVNGRSAASDFWRTAPEQMLQGPAKIRKFEYEAGCEGMAGCHSLPIDE
jgi:hypothetical protein